MACKKGFTLIELLMTMAILAILSVSGAWLLIYLVQSSVIIPNKLNADMVAQEAMDIMIEGDRQARGLRFSRNITESLNESVAFKNADNLTVRFRWDSGNKKIYRQINSSAEAVIPYYLGSGVTVAPAANASVFSYYDADETSTTDSAGVRRVKMRFKVMTGSGNYSDWEGQAEHVSFVCVRKFE